MINFSAEERAVIERALQTEQLALTYVRRLRARVPHAVPPEVVWRCRDGCLLVAAYTTPAGVILYFPAVRLSRAYASRRSGHHARGSAANPDWKPDGQNVVRLPERAVMCNEEGTPVCCRHLLQTYRAGELRADLDLYRSTGTPQRRTLSHSA